jgi:hypothetical protein
VDITLKVHSAQLAVLYQPQLTPHQLPTLQLLQLTPLLPQPLQCTLLKATLLPQPTQSLLQPSEEWSLLLQLSLSLLPQP